MQIKQWVILCLSFFSFVLFGLNETFAPTSIPLEYPTDWPEPTYDFSKNPLTEEGVFLGRKLFYEPLLSKNNMVSCSSCHLSFTAFTHVDHALSHGINDSIGNRNSLALINLAWSEHFMWDGAAHHLDVQALSPISDPKELGEDFNVVIQKLQKTSLYPSLFYQAFGDSILTGEYLLKALSQFQLTFVSANSKYDKVMRKEEGVSFTTQEEKGYQVFKKNCSSCHIEPLFTNGGFENNGLAKDSILNDLGRFSITQNPEDLLRFKVPTLRNIKYSFPYMHDGRFRKLSQVINHYSNDVIPSSTLSPLLTEGLNLSHEEKVDLLAFLLTLSDKKFVFNQNFTYPKN